MSMMVSFCAVFFPRGVLGEILNLIGSVSGGFPSYFCTLLALFAAFSLSALYKRSRAQIPNGPASNLKLTLPI